MAKIVVSAVSKLYRGGVEAVRDVSFEVPDGRVCALVGAAGAGKTTLLRLIAAREAPTSGTIEVGDSVSQSWRLGWPEIVEYADAAELKPGRNVYDAMAAGFLARGFKRSEAKAATLKAADALGLAPLMARRLDAVSTGERSLAALGRALSHPPRAILLDEPFSGLGPARRIELRRALARLSREGATIVVATQSWTDALALADVLVLLDGGRVVASGPAEELHDAPPTADAARLTGDPAMNLLPVRANQTGLSLEDGTHLGGASVMTGATFLLLGVRPENLFVAGDGGPPAAAILPVKVEEIERAGSDSFVHGHVGPHPVTAKLAGSVEPSSSGLLKLGARRESLRLYDAETGARI